MVSFESLWGVSTGAVVELRDYPDDVVVRDRPRLSDQVQDAEDRNPQRHAGREDASECLHHPHSDARPSMIGQPWASWT
jgi:hypothetical protein